MRLLLILAFLNCAWAIEEIIEGGSCGEDQIPYRIQIKKDGGAVLSCTQPACLGHDYKLTQDLIILRRQKNRRLKIKCYEYEEKACEEDLEWTGGLRELNNGSKTVMQSKCCEYKGMEMADISSIYNLFEGENHAGGLIRNNNTIVGFELIKEVKRMKDGKRWKYVVTIARLPCFMNEKDEKSLSKSVYPRSVVRHVAARIQEQEDYEHEEEEPNRIGSRHPYFAREYHRRPSHYRRRYRPRPVDYDFIYSDEQEERYAGRPYPRSKKRLPSLASNSIWPFANNHPRQHGQTTYSNNDQLYNGVHDVVEGGIPRNELETMPSGPAAAKGIGSYEPASYINTELPLPPPNREELESQIAPVPPPGVNSYNVAPPSYPEPNSYVEQPVQARQALPEPPSMPQPPVQMPAQQVVYQPAYNYYPAYPAYSGSGLNGFVNKLQCFSGDTEVTTAMGTKLMKDLKTGDSVLSIDEHMVTFSPVIMFLHNLPEEEAEFLKIELDSGDFVKMTQDHLVYINSCKPKEPLRLVHAKEVEQGHCMFVIDSGRTLNRQTVSNITKVNDIGIFAPLTSTGDIFVNGILSSCHSNVGMKTLQQTFFTVYRGASSVYKRFFPDSTTTQELPLGVEYLTGVIDLFLPKSYL